MRIFNWLRSLRSRFQRSASHIENTSGKIFFEGGNGDAPEAAIVVRGARYDLEGTYAEFGWLTHMYGQKDHDWKLISHSHGVHVGRDIDTFVLRLADGRALTVFFDCTESFGKSPHPSTESPEPRVKRRLDDTVPPDSI